MLRSLLLNVLIVWIGCAVSFSQNVGIGTNSPNAAAKLEVQSTNSGVLVPRLSTSQKNSIPSPPAGLLVYDNTLNAFSYFNGTQWTSIIPGNDTIWNASQFNGEVSINNRVGQHLYMGGNPILSIGSVGNIDGVLTVQHSNQPPFVGQRWISMDGNTIQARVQNGTFSSPPVDGNLIINRFGGNVGINIAVPTSRLHIHTPDEQLGFLHQGDNASMATFIGGGGRSTNSFGGYLGTESNNPLHFYTNRSWAQMSLLQDGSVGIGTTAPAAKLHVTSSDPLYSGILGTGSGYTSVFVPDPVQPYTLLTHSEAVSAQASNSAVALQIYGAVAVNDLNNNFIMDIWPQTGDRNAVGYYSSLGNGYWAINLNGTGSILNDPSFNPTGGYIFVTPFFAWSSNASSSFNIPSRTMTLYDNATGTVRYVLDVEPIQIGKPIIRLRVMVVRFNPDSILN